MQAIETRSEDGRIMFTIPWPIWNKSIAINIEFKFIVKLFAFNPLSPINVSLLVCLLYLHYNRLSQDSNKRTYHVTKPYLKINPPRLLQHGLHFLNLFNSARIIHSFSIPPSADSFDFFYKFRRKLKLWWSSVIINWFQKPLAKQLQYNKKLSSRLSNEKFLTLKHAWSRFLFY